MPRLPDQDPEPPLRKVRERPLVTDSGVLRVKTGFVVVRGPREAAEVRGHQEEAVRELLDWYGTVAPDGPADR